MFCSLLRSLLWLLNLLNELLIRYISFFFSKRVVSMDEDSVMSQIGIIDLFVLERLVFSQSLIKLERVYLGRR